MLSVPGKKDIIGGEVYTEGSATVSMLGSPAFVILSPLFNRLERLLRDLSGHIEKLERED